MRIEAYMKTAVISITPQHTVREAAALMVEKHIGSLPVVDEGGVLIGLLTINDILELFLPNFVRLLAEIDFVPDFGDLEERQISAEAAAQSVRAVMRAPLAVRRSSGLLRAFAELSHHNVPDLPIVDENDRLVGIVSRVDVGTAFLSQWHVSTSTRPGIT
jgi:CBS domain-containing protein